MRSWRRLQAFKPADDGRAIGPGAELRVGLAPYGSGRFQHRRGELQRGREFRSMLDVSVHQAERTPRLKSSREHFLLHDGVQVGAAQSLAHLQDEAGVEPEAL